MALIDEVKQICDRLAPLGWGELFQQQGLDITASDLSQELSKSLTVDRTLPGFADFAPNGDRAIEPASPARSLLYHALASPAVHLTDNGLPASNPDVYATLEELDILENYIYSVANRQLSELGNVVIAIFAYQYRIGSRSPHGNHADLAYSRTGVARVGTAPPNYDPMRRSFWIEATDGSDNLAVLPARYGAFLAVERMPGQGNPVLDSTDEDDRRQFLFPIHKLFPGSECLTSLTLDLDFLEYHLYEKLKRVHTEGNIPLFPGFDVNQAPFIRDSRNSDDLVQLQFLKGSALLIPVPHQSLVRTATQQNTATGREEMVRFRVPPQTGNNRFWTSHEITARGNGRIAPEYVNIRHQVETSPTGEQTLIDLNQTIPDEDQFLQTLATGNFEAAHFIDDSCDGCMTVRVTGLPSTLPSRPAYSLVAAPDFFPLADQIDIERWKDAVVPNLRDHFRQGGPSPLSEGRFAGNPSLINPLTNDPAFDRADVTLTSIVGTTPQTLTPSRDVGVNLSVSFLPDAAANVFAPGWDISLGQDNDGLFYAAYGLGSPFPEDAKLCAALNSFWPAVAPDAARTFGLVTPPTALPMLDEELGYYRDHPKVKGGEVSSRPGWDGEFGPFFEEDNGFVNFANRDRSDYVSHALAGLIRVTPPLARIDSTELINRMEALRLCIRTLPPTQDVVATTSLLLVVAEKVKDWSSRSDRADTTVTGPGYLYEFALVDETATEITSDIRRKRFPVENRFTCQVTQQGLFWRMDQDPFTFSPG
ncbi:MAG: hypothetical protein AAGF26_15870 [Cyanobacteria bacterium P01_G01_bin.49]